MKEQLRQAIEAVLKDCYAEGLLSSGEVPAEIQLEVPKNAEHGDFATNLAMMLAKPERKAPRQVAEILLPKLQSLTICASVEIAGPGFINFRLSPSCWYELLDQITEQGAAYGKSKGRCRNQDSGRVCQCQSDRSAAYRPWSWCGCR